VKFGACDHRYDGSFLCYLVRPSNIDCFCFLELTTHNDMENVTPSDLQKRYSLHRKKMVREFPVPSRDVNTKLSMGGNNDVITELFLPRGSLVSDIPAGKGKIVNLFLRCIRFRIGNSLPDKKTTFKPFFCGPGGRSLPVGQYSL
jgi:hypothetical protein